jgi:hypothetical protein
VGFQREEEAYMARGRMWGAHIPWLETLAFPRFSSPVKANFTTFILIYFMYNSETLLQQMPFLYIHAESVF